MIAPVKRAMPLASAAPDDRFGGPGAAAGVLAGVFVDATAAAEGVFAEAGATGGPFGEAGLASGAFGAIGAACGVFGGIGAAAGVPEAGFGAAGAAADAPPGLGCPTGAGGGGPLPFATGSSYPRMPAW